MRLCKTSFFVCNVEANIEILNILPFLIVLTAAFHKQRSLLNSSKNFRKESLNLVRWLYEKDFITVNVKFYASFLP